MLDRAARFRFFSLAALALLASCRDEDRGALDAQPAGDARAAGDAALDAAVAAADAADGAPPADLALAPDAYLWPDYGADRPLRQVEGLRDEALKRALRQLVQNQAPLGYTKAKAAIFVPAQGGLDVHDGMIECVYTGTTVAADGTTAPGGFNVEHSWPQSEGADTGPAESDLHHLFPTTASSNSRRGSLPFGDTACGSIGAACNWEQGGSQIGPEVSSGTRVFEVRPARRGDIARAHFYFAVRYALAIPAAEEAALRRWNAQDLPDAGERARNDAIEGLQHNRNPFVERPDLVEQIADF